MAKEHCEDCGCAVYSGRCTNCHESLYILDQYYEQGMAAPDEDTDFMKEVSRDLVDVSKKLSRGKA